MVLRVCLLQENLQTAEWSDVLERVIALPEHKSIGLDELRACVRVVMS